MLVSNDLEINYLLKYRFMTCILMHINWISFSQFFLIHSWMSNRHEETASSVMILVKLVVKPSLSNHKIVIYCLNKLAVLLFSSVADPLHLAGSGSTQNPAPEPDPPKCSGFEWIRVDPDSNKTNQN